MREFGELLRTHRIHAGLTQQQLADFAMVSVRAIRDLECGRTRTPRAETVRLLADGLRLDDTSRADLAQAGGRPAAKAGVAPPAPAASIVGREAETAALVALLVGGFGPGERRGVGDARDALFAPDARDAADARHVPDARFAADARHAADGRNSTDARHLLDAPFASDARTPAESRTSSDARGSANAGHVPGARFASDARRVPDARFASDARHVPDARYPADARHALDTPSAARHTAEEWYSSGGVPHPADERRRFANAPYPAEGWRSVDDPTHDPTHDSTHNPAHNPTPDHPRTNAEPPRLVTITGVSGVGKTRLALEAAGELHFRHGWSVLWHLTSLPAVDDEQDTVLVTDRCPDPRLLADHPRLRVVVTAPAPTGLAGEHVFPLAALPDDAAVRLLLTHVHRVRPGFRAEPANQAALTGLVKALDGLPSALEFAAGWFMVYSPQHLLERLRSNPKDPTSAHLRDALRRSLSTLDDDGRRKLRDLIEGRESHEDVRDLSVRGLVRNVGGRYEVLNLVRAAATEPVAEPHYVGGVALTWPC
ncbi:helix-turn-helix domain-containing protein [Lentzea sp. NPDC060358]|uniref:helix-turn-helix domain-containing protein n=1 Tax=Lentzea sp. NPDC060358 TaxID=3347103 RepID=UPI00365F38C9